MTDWKSVPVPHRLAGRPRDARGYPVPVSVLVKPDGKPDFRVTDSAAWKKAAAWRTCALCGVPLGRHLAFVGGPRSMESRLFLDLPMHRDCAEYALQVCPFLAAPRFRYAEAADVEVSGIDIQVSSAVSDQRPDVFFLGMTTAYDLVQLPDGTVAARAAPWGETVRWRHGRPALESCGSDTEKTGPIGA